MSQIENSTIYFGLWVFLNCVLVYYIFLEIYLYLALLGICYYGYQRLAETAGSSRIAIRGQGVLVTGCDTAGSSRIAIRGQGVLVTGCDTALLCICYYGYQRLAETAGSSRIAIKGQGVLVTGCDTGFGHETAVRLDKLGFTVFAGCLLPEGDGAKKLRKTGSKRLHVLHLDVTKDEHVQKSVAYVSKNCQNSGLWAVINNAAINRCCDIELASIELMKRVAEVNYYGTARVTKACINMLRQSGGRVINVSSVRGRVALPTDVSYTCTKWAVEAFSDILRREMRRFGVKVAIIEPGNFGGITGMLMPKTIASMEEELSSAWDASSADTKKAYGRQYIDALLGSFHSTGQSSHATMEPVIAAMEDAVTSASPRHRYLVSGGTKLLDWYTVAAVLNSYLPEVLMDYLIRVFEPLPPVDFSTRLSH